MRARRRQETGPGRDNKIRRASFAITVVGRSACHLPLAGAVTFPGRPGRGTGKRSSSGERHLPRERRPYVPSFSPLYSFTPFFSFSVFPSGVRPSHLSTIPCFPLSVYLEKSRAHPTSPPDFVYKLRTATFVFRRYSTRIRLPRHKRESRK